jgi:hypothetical protein
MLLIQTRGWVWRFELRVQIVRPRERNGPGLPTGAVIHRAPDKHLDSNPLEPARCMSFALCRDAGGEVFASAEVGHGAAR